MHLITRAQGGLHDYQAFLHEAGHALHYAGCDPSLPYTFRKLSRDHALTEIYSYIFEAVTREPGWHAEHFGLRDEQADECRGDDVPGGAALSPLRGEALLRARDRMSTFRFHRWAYPIAAALVGLHLVIGQAEPVKYALKRAGPEPVCEWNKYHLPLLPLPWCKQARHNEVLSSARARIELSWTCWDNGVSMIDRRTIMTAALAAIAAPASVRIGLAQTSMSRITAYGFSFPALEGGDIRLADFAGRPFMVVNTASLCGYTPQYAGLQELWTQFHDRGLTIVGVPSNDFGGQEPGSSKEIAETAQHQYGVTFPIAAKTVVKGPNAHPFYKWAAEARPKELPRWNFHKYLVGRDGYIADVFAESVEPADTRIKTAIARTLADT